MAGGVAEGVAEGAEYEGQQGPELGPWTRLMVPVLLSCSLLLKAISFKLYTVSLTGAMAGAAFGARPQLGSLGSKELRHLWGDTKTGASWGAT